MTRFLLPPRARRAAATVLCLALAPLARAGDDAFADEVVSYDPGTGAAAGYTTPEVALGPPERYTGEGIDPSAVTSFNPAWRPDEIVSIGAGGSLVLRFDTPVTDDPDNPWGIDLLVFGNAFFIDAGGGMTGTPAGLFAEGGEIAVSDDGVTWVTVPSVVADGLFPTEGWADLPSPYEGAPGAVETDFTKPVNPAHALASLGGLGYEEIVELYAGSGGGAGIDLATTGLAAVTHVRIRVGGGAAGSPEIDAVADVRARRPGDATLDGAVNVQDLLEVLAHWGPSGPLGWDADLDADGTVAVSDLLLVLAEWDQP